jgi:hypothetical protein
MPLQKPSWDTTGILLYLLASTLAAVWWASSVDQSVRRLIAEANKGERYTYAMGMAQAEECALIEKRLDALDTWRATIDEHKRNHDKFGVFWTGKINENEKRIRACEQKCIYQK